MRGFSLAAISALVTVLWTVPAQGQLVMGAKGGLSLTTMSLSTDGTSLSPGTRTTFHGAAIVGMMVSPGFAIEGQMRFAGKGFEPGGEGSGVAGNLSMEYVEIPILATFTFPSEPSLLAARAFAGPSVGLRASCNLESSPDQTGFTNCDGDLSKTFDFSLTAGAGFKIGRGIGGIIFDVSYDFGLLDVTASGSATSARNRSLLFSVGAIVPII